MATKIKIGAPAAVGAAAGTLAGYFLAKKMDKKKRILAMIAGAIGGGILGQMTFGEKFSNASGSVTVMGRKACKGCPPGTSDSGSGCMDSNGINHPYAYGEAYCKK